MGQTLVDEQEKKEMNAMDNSLGGALCGLILAGLVWPHAFPPEYCLAMLCMDHVN